MLLEINFTSGAVSKDWRQTDPVRSEIPCLFKFVIVASALALEPPTLTLVRHHEHITASISTFNTLCILLTRNRLYPEEAASETV